MSTRVRVGIAALCAALAGCGTEGAPPDLAFEPDVLPGAELGQPYSVTIAVSGNETPVSILDVEQGSPPPGISLAHRPTESAGVLAGTPTQPGTYSFAIRAECFGTMRPGQVGTKAYAIVVLDRATRPAGR